LTPGGYWVGKIHEIVALEPFFKDVTKMEHAEFCGDVLLCLAQKSALDGELEISRECSDRLYRTLGSATNLEKYQKMKEPINPGLMRVNEMIFCRNCKEGEGFGKIAQIYPEYIDGISVPDAIAFLSAFMDERIKDCVGIAELHLNERPNEDAAKCMELLSIVAGRYDDFDEEITQRIVKMYSEEEVTLASLQYKKFCAVILAMTSYKGAREKSNGIYSICDDSDADFYAKMADMISESIPEPENRLASLEWVYAGVMKEWDESPSAVWPNWDKS
jgi:hypothetical protein